MTFDLEDVKLWRASGKSWDEIAGLTSLSSGEAARKRFARAAARVDHVPPEYPDWKVPETPNWREWLDAFDAMLELHKRADNIVSKLTIDIQTEIPIAIASASDLHMGGGFTNHKSIRKTLDFILETPNLYVGIAGDSIEGFIPGVKGAASSDQMAGSIGAQLHAMDSLVDELTAAGKLLYWTWGDHDAKWFEDRVGLNVVKRLLDRKVPYFAGRGLVRLKVCQQDYLLHVNHGEKWQSQLNETYPQRKMYDMVIPADVTISGHLHKPAYHVAYRYDNLRELGYNIGGKTLFVQNGTFKTGPDPYSTRWWTQGIMGVPTLVFGALERDLDVFDSPWKAVQYLRGLSSV